MEPMIRKSSRSNKGTNRYLQDRERAELEYMSKKAQQALLDVDEPVKEVVRCLVCGTTDRNYDEESDPHGDMVQCDRCDTWQHIRCMTGKDEMPDSPNYFCDVCEPDNYPNLKHSIDPKQYLASKAKDQDWQEDDGESFQAPEVTEIRAVKKRKVPPKRKSSSELQAIKLRESATGMLEGLFAKHIIPDVLATSDFVLSESETVDSLGAEMARNLEEEIYKHFEGDVKQQALYREKVRVLFSNLKDPKNYELKKLVIQRQLGLDKLVTMPVNDLVNPDLQEFREAVDTKAMDQLIVERPNKPRYHKTHKGDELIEDPIENENEPEDIIFNKDIIAAKRKDLNNSIDEEGSFGGHSEDPTPESASQSDAAIHPQVSNHEKLLFEITVDYSDIACHFKSELYYIGSSEHVEQKVVSEVVGDAKLRVEGRLSAAEGDKYLIQMSNSRIFLAFRLKAKGDDQNFAEFDRLFEFLTSRQRYGALEPKKSYVRHVYMIPCENHEYPDILDCISSTEGFSKNAKNVFVIAVVRSDLIK
ncbi:LAMI_0G03620g1_1 [Lachancea mirantina]|uniref:Transcription factor BYE1 n=1 Tax=Lachancea mirantina TaxID=1230905 RepID=A0A1G4K883_9SACH|nr:LAMI_0G03620g1_1 [Lachancea mirantina]